MFLGLNLGEISRTSTLAPRMGRFMSVWYISTITSTRVGSSFFVYLLLPVPLSSCCDEAEPDPRRLRSFAVASLAFTLASFIIAIIKVSRNESSRDLLGSMGRMMANWLVSASIGSLIGKPLRRTRSHLFEYAFSWYRTGYLYDFKSAFSSDAGSPLSLSGPVLGRLLVADPSDLTFGRGGQSRPTSFSNSPSSSNLKK